MRETGRHIQQAIRIVTSIFYSSICCIFYGFQQTVILRIERHSESAVDDSSWTKKKQNMFEGASQIEKQWPQISRAA